MRTHLGSLSLVILASSLLSLKATGATILTFGESVINVAIPDYDDSGVARSVILSDAELQAYDVEVNFEVSSRGLGAFNGDYYAYLGHETAAGDAYVISVLVNRPGRSASLTGGYSDAGMSVTLTDSAEADIHTYRLSLTGSAGTPLAAVAPFTGVLTGSWQPDGRLVDPEAVTEASPRTTPLNALGAIDPNGTWTFFIADMAPGGEGTLNSWSVTLTPVIPEPWTGFLVMGSALLALRRRR